MIVDLVFGLTAYERQWWPENVKLRLWLSCCDKVACTSCHSSELVVFVIVDTACLTSLMPKIFILQSVYWVSQHLPWTDVPLVDDAKGKWLMSLSLFFNSLERTQHLRRIMSVSFGILLLLSLLRDFKFFLCVYSMRVLAEMRVPTTTSLYVCVFFLFVCKIVSAVVLLPGIISSSQREIFDKARTNIFINERMVKRHGERTKMLSYCGASPAFSEVLRSAQSNENTETTGWETWMVKSQD